MKISYDSEVDAAYLSFKRGRTQVTTVRLTEDIAVDFDSHEEIVGIEVLDASKHLGIKRQHPEIQVENLKARVA